MPLNKEALKPVRHFTKLLFSPFVKQSTVLNSFELVLFLSLFSVKSQKKKDSLLNTPLEELHKQPPINN